MKKFFLTAFPLFLMPLCMLGQSVSDLDKMDFEELLNVDVITVSSRKPLTKKQVPGNVTVFNESEIANTGARNLIDLLRLVPGLEFGNDVQNGIGLGVRGNWAQEGKALFVVDGIPVNENLYGTPVHMLYFPVHQIRQLEVIRGPGASFYGGYAELAVINIKTKLVDGYQGSDVQFLGGLSSSGPGTLQASALSGGSFKKGFLNASVYTGAFRRGEGLYQDANAATFNVYEGNRNAPTMVMLNGGYQNLKAQLLLRDDRGTHQEAFHAFPGPLTIKHRMAIGQLLHEFQINPKWDLISKINLSFFQPWQIDTLDADAGNDIIYDHRATRLSISTLLAGEISGRWNSLTGIEVFQDHGRAKDPYGYFGVNADQSSVRYTNIAAFTQHNLQSSIALFNAGIRFDYNNSFGSAVNPWVGVNREFGKWNTKLLWGNTFKAPTIENVHFAENGEMKPERTRLFEAEVGYQLTPNAFFSVTLFDQKIKDAIVFSVNNANIEGYYNVGTTGSRGFETELRLNKFNTGYLNLSYSFYAAAYSQVAAFQVEGQSQYHLGFARHKISAAGSYNLSKSLTVNPTFTWLGKRYGYRHDPALAGQAFPMSIATFDPLLLMNINVRKTNVIKGMDITLSIMDLLNARYDFIQPYDSFASPLNGIGREVLLTLGWRFP